MRSRLSLCVLIAVAEGCSLNGAGRTASEPLTKITPITDTVPRDSGWILVEKGVDRTRADHVARYFEAQFPAGRGVRGIYRVPKLPEQLVVVASGPNSPSDYGLRLFLIATSDSAVTVVASTKGFMDSDWIDPVWFVGPASRLLLSDIGSESSWGLMAFEVTPSGFQSLGDVPAAEPGSPESGWHSSALPYTSVWVDRGRYVVEFAGDVMHDPAGKTERLVRGSVRAPVKYRWEGSGFVLQ